MWIKRNKPKAQKIFVSGVFDILHYGHIDFLRQAKALAGKNGKLIVAIHDDKSVSVHKGKDRPINTAEYRAGMLRAVRYVDEVIVWHGWENITELVDEIKPDYIAVSGDEYQKKTVRDFANEHGIELAIFPKTNEISTTKLIEKLKN